MLHITTWSPDTCGCVLEYEWDDAVPEASRVHNLKRVAKACPHHTVFTVGQAIEKTQQGEENSRKNKALAKIEEFAGIKPSEADWSFDNNRAVVIKVKGLLPSHRVNLQSQLDSLGKVRLE